jgi:hypothetical protein
MSLVTRAARRADRLPWRRYWIRRFTVSTTRNVVTMELSDDRFELVDESLVSIAVWRTPTNLLLFYVARVPGGRKAAA